MNEQMKKPSAGIAILGFLLTFLLTIALLADGVLLGLKTTIFKGSDMVDVLKNANLFETFTEVVVSEVTVMTENEMLGDVAATVFSEDAMVKMAEDVTQAIKNDEDVDLSGMKDTCMEEIKNISDEVVDDIIAEIEGGSGEINAETLAGNEALQALQAQYGVDITGIVMEYVEETYGTTSISVDEIDLEAVKTQAKETVDEVVLPAMEEAIDEYIVEVNRVVNEEIRTITREYDISGMLTKIENAIDTLTTTVMILSIAVAVLALLEIVVYIKYRNRAFRNVGISTVVSGLFVAILGLIVVLIKSLVTGLLGNTGEKAEQVIVDFIDSNISNIGYRILLIGGIYILVAIICFVVAGKIKKRNLK